MIVLYVLGYFNRNKQNSYAALIIGDNPFQVRMNHDNLGIRTYFHGYVVDIGIVMWAIMTTYFSLNDCLLTLYKLCIACIISSVTLQVLF